MKNKNASLFKPHILIVDNDPVQRRLMKESLLCDDYIISDAGSSHEALEYFSKQVPEIILLDEKMPEKSGYQICAEVRKKYDAHDISIIMVTGHDNSESIKKALHHGATSFISKPINWNIFPYQIQYALKAQTVLHELKEREIHLNNTERISHILTQGNNRDHILQNALEAILEIFGADRACIINFTGNQPANAHIIYQALKGSAHSLYGDEDKLTQLITHNIKTENNAGSASHTSHNKASENDCLDSLSIFNQILVPLNQRKTQSYFLVLHQCSPSPAWTRSDHKTLKVMAERLGSVLSQHLLIKHLLKNENLLRQAQHVGHLGNWSWDINNNQITWSNEVYKIYGKTAGIFKPTCEYIKNATYPDDIKSLRSFKKSILLTGKAHSIEFRIVMPNDVLRHVYLHAKGTLNNKNEVVEINGTIQDVTDTKITTSALLESEARFRRLAENAPDVIFRISLPDEKFEYVSPAANKLFGYEPGEFKNIAWLIDHVINPENKAYFQSQWDAIKQEGNTTDFEYVIQKKTGEQRHLNQHNALILDDNNQPVAIEGIISDITTQKRIYKKLLESENDMRSILSNLQDTFFRINKFGRIIMTSESARELLGWTPFDLLGKKFSDLFIDLDEYDNFINTLSNNDGKLVSYQVRIKRKNNDIRWISLSIHSSESSTGFIEGTARDVTDILKQQEQDARDQKMEAIGQLTGGVVHDFGNLITIVKGNLDLLNEGFMDNPGNDYDAIELLNDARSAINDGVGLIKQLLTFSSKKAVTPQHTDAGKTITGFHQLLKNTLGDRIKLSIHIQDELPDIIVDPTQFKSALLNIVINARDAMPDGGNFSIIAETVRLPPNPIEYVSITLKDDGIGMDNDVIKRVTEPFFTTKQSKGTGLGLSTVYGFVQQAHGKFNIISSPDNGTSINLTFPAYSRRATQQAEENSQNLPHHDTTTVLVVENREAVRRFAIRCLKKLKLNILEADNATDAQQILEENNNIDLLFSDITMPGEINGHALALWASNKLPNLKILLTTTAENDDHQLKTEEQEQFSLLQKPYNQQDLINQIQKML